MSLIIHYPHICIYYLPIASDYINLSWRLRSSDVHLVNYNSMQIASWNLCNVYCHHTLSFVYESIKELISLLCLEKWTCLLRWRWSGPSLNYQLYSLTACYICHISAGMFYQLQLAPVTHHQQGIVTISWLLLVHNTYMGPGTNVSQVATENQNRTSMSISHNTIMHLTF